MKKLLLVVVLIPLLLSCEGGYVYRKIPHITSDSMIVSGISEEQGGGGRFPIYYYWLIRFSSTTACRDTLLIYQTSDQGERYECPFKLGDVVKLRK